MDSMFSEVKEIAEHLGCRMVEQSVFVLFEPGDIRVSFSRSPQHDVLCELYFDWHDEVEFEANGSSVSAAFVQIIDYIAREAPNTFWGAVWFKHHDALERF